MKIEIDLQKTIPENAAHYYERSKKARKKLEGLREAIKKTRKDLKEAEKKEESEIEGKKLKKIVRRERDWYEKFHWFFTTDGFLVVAGKDMKGNQLIVKTYMENHDLYLHADIQGAPSTIIVAHAKDVPDSTKKQAADFAAAFSKAFSSGLGAVDVYCVKPEQVKTAAKAGEFLPKGGFVISGKREWFRHSSTRVAVAFDPEKKRPFSGPEEAVKEKTSDYFLVVPGKNKKGEIAKQMKKEFDEKHGVDSDLTEIVQVLPPGKCDFVKERRKR